MDLNILWFILVAVLYIVFFLMASLYWSQPEKENPALYVRASMSVPYFFSPLKISNIPQGQIAKRNWSDTVSFDGELPQEVFLVDGGVMSNFPNRCIS